MKRLLTIAMSIACLMTPGVGCAPLATPKEPVVPATVQALPSLPSGEELEMAKLAEVLHSCGLSDHHLAPLFQDREVGTAYVLSIPGKQAVSTWRLLRAIVEKTGYYPVLLGYDEGKTAHLQTVQDIREPIGQILETANGVDPSAWLQHRAANDPEGYRIEPAEWPNNQPANNDFLIPRDVLTQRPLPIVWIALLPTQVPWEVPALLRFGGWNECSEPALHVALMKRWHARYGAEVVGVSGDVVEMRVSRLPSDRAQALALAREQFLYCPDLVYQGVGSVEALAATLLGSHVWYFWWD